MTAFVWVGCHADIRLNYTLRSHRSPWARPRTISYRTSQFCGRSFIPQRSDSQREVYGRLSTPMAMFSGGGILGVGPSEVVVVLAVGWLLLGPQKLFSLAKDSGRLLGELRRTADEARNTLNDAMELDMVAAEFEESKKMVQENGLPDSGSDDETSDETDKLVSSSVDSTDDTDDSTDDALRLAEAENSIEPVNSAFLEQLQRVADPDQKPPEEVPDLDPYLDEELEVQRLEKQYFEARNRLENRRKQGTENTTSESEPVVEER